MLRNEFLKKINSYFLLLLGNKNVIPSYQNGNINEYISHVSSILDLKKIDTTNSKNPYTAVGGYYSIGDGGGGEFYYESTSQEIDDGGITIKPEYKGFGGVGRWKRIINENFIDVKWFGAKGDGIHDDTAAISKCINNNIDINKIILSPGKYKITDTILVNNTNIKIIGSGRDVTIINQENNSKYCFAVIPKSDFGWCALEFKDFSIYSKYGIVLNQMKYKNISDVPGGNNPIFSGLSIAGEYAKKIDENYESNIQPSKNELIDYGVGISIVKFFNFEISNCLFLKNGIAIYADACDIGIIEKNRFTVNARNIHIYSHDYLGSQNKIVNNDILANKRIGGIYLENAKHTTIDDNYFETYTQSGVYIQTSNDQNTIISNNRFDGIRKIDLAGSPFIKLSPNYGMIVYGNRAAGESDNYPESIIDIGTDFYNYSISKILIKWTNNSNTFPVPNHPAAITHDLEPYRFAFDNWSSRNSDPRKLVIVSGANTNKFPWIKDSISQKWNVKTDLTPTFIYFFLPEKGLSNFLIKVTGKRIDKDLFGSVDYEEDRTTYILLKNQAWGFSEDKGSQTITKFIKLPNDINGIGSIVFKYESLNTVEIENILLVPIEYELQSSLPDHGLYKTSDIIYNVNPDLHSNIGWYCIKSGALFKNIWDSNKIYFKNDWVEGSDGKIYSAQRDNGQNQDPISESNNVYWKLESENAAMFKKF